MGGGETGKNIGVKKDALTFNGETHMKAVNRRSKFSGTREKNDRNGLDLVYRRFRKCVVVDVFMGGRWGSS